MRNQPWLRIILLTVAMIGVLAACGAADEPSTPLPPTPDSDALSPAEPQESEEAIPDQSDSVPPEGYPAPPVPQDTVEGYPAPAPLPTPVSPYPAGELVWVLLAVGEQCADESENSYPDLQAAVADLAASGVPVVASEMADLMVCTACGCPTSAHFRVQIEASNLGQAEALGWMAEE